MADISRYKGGAAKAKPAAGRRRQIVGPTQGARTQARNEETRRMNPASQPAEQNENDRRTLNLDTGSFQEEIPIAPVQERGRRISVPRPRVGGVEVEPTSDGVRGRVRFAKGGVIEPARGDFIEIGENGPKRRVTANEINARRNSGTKPPRGARKRG